MQLLFFRHAERFQTPPEDPLLTPRGLLQAEELKNLVALGQFSRPQKIMTSPRTRAIQTATPLAQFLKVPLQVSTDLDEKQNLENLKSFGLRIQRFINELEQLSGTALIVTHFDWIEEALLYIPSEISLTDDKYHHWKPGEGWEFEIENGLWTPQKKLKLLPKD